MNGWRDEPEATQFQIGELNVIVEHSFVTTLPSQTALTAASEMLAAGGFLAEAQDGFRVGETQWTTLQMKRGKKTSARAKDPTECPQRIRLDWDRGRVTVAASIEPKSRRRGYYYGGLLGLALAAADQKSGKATKDYTDLLIVISIALEDLLARRSPPDVAVKNWYALQNQLKIKAKKSRTRSWIVLAIFLAVMIGLVVFAVIAGNMR